VFENRVLTRIFGLKRDEVTGDWRKLHHEELHKLYSSPNGMIKSTKMKWAGHVACLGRRGMCIGYWWESQKEGDLWVDQAVDRWTILKYILESMEWYGLD
jgi:hypothetical protein